MDVNKNDLKIKQFEWYQVQTKIRQFVFQILQPFQKKQIQQSSKVLQLRREVASYQQKVKQLSFLLQMSEQKPAYFMQIEKKMQQIKKTINELKINNKQQIQNVNSKLIAHNNRFDKADVLLKICQDERNSRICDNQEIMKIIQDKSKHTLQNLQIQNILINNINSKFTTSIQRLQQRILMIQNKHGNSEQHYKQIQKQVQSIKQSNLKIQMKILQVQSKNEQNKKQIQRIQEVTPYFKKFTYKIQEIKNEFLFIENYIDKYLPLFVQSQISDTLNSCIFGKQKILLCEYEQRIFNQISNRIMKEGYKKQNLQQNIKNSMSLVQKIIKKNKRCLIQQKLEQNHENVLQHNLQSENREKKQIKIEKQSKYQTKKMISQQISNLKNDLQAKIKQIQQIFQLQSKQSNYIINKNIHQIQLNIQTLNVNHKKYQTHFHQQIDQIHKQFQYFQFKQKQNPKKIIQILAILKQITYFMNIINHLLIQDQIDKQGIALYGLRQNFTQKPTVILQSKCLSCSGNSINSINAFKMACLAYNPSTIQLNGKQYRRQQILENASQILQNIKQILSSNKNLLQNMQLQTSNERVQRKMSKILHTNETSSKTILLPSIIERSQSRKKKISRQKKHNTTQMLF